MARTLHNLKCWPKFYADVESGAKTFEVRKNDRHFQVGDFLRLREWNSTTGYSGDALYVEVTYVLRALDMPEGSSYNALHKGFVVLGFKRSNRSRAHMKCKNFPTDADVEAEKRGMG